MKFSRFSISQFQEIFEDRGNEGDQLVNKDQKSVSVDFGVISKYMDDLETLGSILESGADLNLRDIMENYLDDPMRKILSVKMTYADGDQTEVDINDLE